MKVEFFKHSLTEQDIQEASNAMRSLFLSTGPKVSQFEMAFANYVDRKYVVGVNSCTSALFMSLKLFDIGPGDEVITTPLTFAATVNAILYTGAKPVLIDVKPLDGNIDFRYLENAINKRTKAIIPVNLYGTLCDEFDSYAYGLYVIEDAAHSIETAHYRSAQPHTSCFSFYATKNMTCGEGGAIAVNDYGLAQKLRQMRTHGMTKSAVDRHSNSNGFQHWDINMLGYKTNMNDIQASLLLSQLPRMDVLHTRRQGIYQQYNKGLYNIVKTPFVNDFNVSSLHLYTIWVDPEKRDKILNELTAAGIGCTVNYRPIHTLSYYKDMFQGQSFPNAELIGASTISLPFYPSLRDEEISYVINTVKEIVGINV